jgi:hypothetical protein
MTRVTHDPSPALAPEEEFLTRSAAARFLHLAPSTLATWASRGIECAPPMRRHGRRVVYAKSDLIRWSASQRVT